MICRNKSPPFYVMDINIYIYMLKLSIIRILNNYFMKNWLILFTAIITLSACKKKENKQYSVWYIDGKEMKTNNVNLAQGKAITSLEGRNDKGKVIFDIRFRESGLPSAGRHGIKSFAQSGQIEGPLNVIFFIDDVWYDVTQDNVYFLEASKINGKRRMTLAPSWFSRHGTPGEDSVLVYGEFNEP